MKLYRQGDTIKLESTIWTCDHVNDCGARFKSSGKTIHISNCVINTMNKQQIIVGSKIKLTCEARSLFASVKIHRAKTIGKSVTITQHASIGTSFEFCDDKEPCHEFHIPARMVRACFA